ncbi:MAG: aminomethyl-transferring glycine dehydrogenase subunit GcvPA [Candidatus Bathyarchaeota archaeon]|nr:MAG: aminomethyl-transferring glycine dehydrogenase subunit GcvPA [Candidatus Bathyarchaeota archaeon]
MIESFSHPYIPNSTRKIKEEIMREIGIESVEELYADVPRKFRLRRGLNLPDGKSEQDVRRVVEERLSKNESFQNTPVFLGAGCWPHYIPAVVETIVQRTELLTSYTPYQPEISQGLLQALFEYQSMICEILAMDVANSSMYDWASALGEAARMASRLTRRDVVLVPEIIHPERRETLRTYCEPAGIRIKPVDYDRETGQLSIKDLKEKMSNKTAAVYVENPTYLGLIETQVREIAEEVHDQKALFVVGVDPTSLGVLEPPGEYGADIVVGEGQPLGNPMSYGGPLLGIFACRDDMRLIRQMPGRVVGMTTTVAGRERGFCMALQTREQHIRRERATSNICSDETLCSIAAAVYLSLLGPNGLKKLGQVIMSRAYYAMQALANIDGVKAPVFKTPHFKEFTVNFDEAGRTVKEAHKGLLKRQVHGGKDVGREFPRLGETALYCVTEMHSKEDIDRLVLALNWIVRGES